MSWQSDAWNAAKTILLTAGTIANISSTNVDTHARAIAKNYADVSAQQVRDKISEDIKTLRK